MVQPWERRLSWSRPLRRSQDNSLCPGIPAEQALKMLSSVLRGKPYDNGISSIKEKRELFRDLKPMMSIVRGRYRLILNTKSKNPSP